MVGAGASQGRRVAEATGFVAAWMALGAALRLDANAYLVLGVPLTIAFQLGVRRRPLREAWLSAAPPLRPDAPTALIAAALGAVPAVMLAQAIQLRDPEAAAWSLAALGGAVGAAYAIRAFGRAQVAPLLACLAVAGGVGTLVVVAAAAALASKGHPPPAPLDALRAFAWSLAQYVPACFALEEVTFRGVLDAHVWRPGEPRDRRTAAAVAALWGLWHLPVVIGRGASPGTLGATALWLVGFHVAVGVPLAIFWRRSGNLLVPALTHAVLDSVRNALLRT